MGTAATQADNTADRSRAAQQGFTLVEMLIAMLILTFGLLAAGQLIFTAVGSAALARSKGNAALVAQSKLDTLADLFRRDSAAADLANGSHGPEQVEIVNPSTSGRLNRFLVAWAVSTLTDPRPGKVLTAKRVVVTVTPAGTGSSANNRTSLNKVVSISAVFSARVM